MIDLRPYQREAVENCIRLYKGNNTSQLLILPTGTGKTRTFCSIIKELNLRALVISHTSQLKNQLKEQCKRLCPHNLIMSETIQWLGFEKNRKRVEELNFDLLIVDEAHHAASESYKWVIQLFKSQNKLVIGCTATPFRLDRKCVYKIFTSVMLQRNISDMIKEGFLSDIKGYRIKTNIDLKNVKVIKGDFNIGQLASVVNTDNRNELICSTYKRLLNGKKTLIFCVNINHCQEIAKVFQENGLNCKPIHGELTREEQRKRLREFQTGKTKIVSSCQLLTEGFDEPSIEAIILCRPTKSAGLYIQMVGRGLRLHPGKHHCDVIDVTDNAHDICSFPTLITEKVVSESKKQEDSIESMEHLKQVVGIIGTDIVVEEHQFVEKYNKKNINEFQKDYLRKHNIPFIEPLTYEIANIIIANYQIRKANGLG